MYFHLIQFTLLNIFIHTISDMSNQITEDESGTVKKKIKDMNHDEFKEYKRVKERKRRENLSADKKREIREKDKTYQASRVGEQRERMEGLRSLRTEEEIQFENIQARHNMRRFRIGDSDCEEQEDEKKSEERIFLEWYSFFKQNEEARYLLNEKIPDWYARCMDKDMEEKEKRKKEQAESEKNREEQRIKELENQKLAEKGEICVCEYEIDCKYCQDVYEKEKDLFEPNTFSKEEELEFERQDLEAYKKCIREEKKEKGRKKAELARQPMPALPEREMCLYESLCKYTFC